MAMPPMVRRLVKYLADRNLHWEERWTGGNLVLPGVLQNEERAEA